MSSNEKMIRDFIEAWSRLDVDELVAYFTSDGIYHNMPFGPIAGHDNLRQFIAGFINDWTATDWEILNLLAEGSTVMVERVDRTKLGDVAVDLPCFGIFEMEDGKIKVWRDYFDMATYINGASGKS